METIYRGLEAEITETVRTRGVVGEGHVEKERASTLRYPSGYSLTRLSAKYSQLTSIKDLDVRRLQSLAVSQRRSLAKESL